MYIYMVFFTQILGSLICNKDILFYTLIRKTLLFDMLMSSILIKLITAVQAIGVLDRDGEPGGITGHYDLVDTTIGHEDLADLFHIYRNFQTFWKKNTISLLFVDTIYIQKRIWLKRPIMIVTLRWPCVWPNLVCKMIIWRFDWYPPPLAC